MVVVEGVPGNQPSVNSCMSRARVTGKEYFGSGPVGSDWVCVWSDVAGL